MAAFRDLVGTTLGGKLFWAQRGPYNDSLLSYVFVFILVLLILLSIY